MPVSRRKRCTGCGIDKPLSDFWKRKDRPGPTPKCIECCKKDGRQAHQRRKQERNNPPASEKCCGRCKETKPGAEFYPNPVAKDGLSPECRQCRSDRAREYRAEFGNARSEAPPDGMKRCGRCQQSKPVADFHKNRATRDGINNRCKLCAQDTHLAAYVQHKYGISLEDYYTMLDDQNNACAICLKPEAVIHLSKPLRLSVDHNHSTSAVCGLLCYSCNLAVEHLRKLHTSGSLDRAIAYMKENHT